MSIIKTGFIFILVIHGLIHLLGFIKAFDLFEIPQLSQQIDKPIGWIWLLITFLFIVAAFNFGMDKDWAKIAIISVVLSQILISLAWSDAKAGTLPNILIFTVAMIAFLGARFKETFIKNVSESIQRSDHTTHATLINNDIYHLPVPVQKYLHFVDVVGKPKIRNMKVEMDGQMRGKSQDWFDFNALQYSTYDEYERMFFIEAVINKIPTKGYHYFSKKNAKMDIKLLSVFPIVSESSELLRKAETVTLFNDMCIMAPASLISSNIQWELINDNEVNARFTNESISISAKLYFDNDGALTNFYSEDRIDINDKMMYGFSTPIYDYKKHLGYRLPTGGEAIWHYPEGEFVYGKFNIKSITYNVNRIQE